MLPGDQFPCIAFVSQSCIACIGQANLHIEADLNQLPSSNLVVSADKIPSFNKTLILLEHHPLIFSICVYPPSLISFMAQLPIFHHPPWAVSVEGHAAFSPNRVQLYESHAILPSLQFYAKWRVVSSGECDFPNLQMGIQRMRSSIDGSVVPLRSQTNGTGGFTNSPLWASGTLLAWHTLSLVRKTHVYKEHHAYLN